MFLSDNTSCPLVNDKIGYFTRIEGDNVIVDCSFERIDNRLLPKVKFDFECVKNKFGDKFARKLFWQIYRQLKEEFLRLKNTTFGDNSLDEIDGLISMCSEYVEEKPLKYITIEGYIEI